jgi:crotonobetainyl-CoA:carnitine CoA-transferase CaiB-like acyl-CoA transferase
MGAQAGAAQPLSGIRVIDFTAVVAGPWATRLLADCGAEVIKVEAVGDGDLLRFAPPVNDGMSRVYAHFNRGKKSVTLDLKSRGGLEVARGLVRCADVVVENFRPGVMARLGLDYETVSKDNPRLVYCSVSGYGQDGPDAGKAAYAPVVHAASGFDHVMATTQNGDGAPLNAGVMIADFTAGIYAFGAIQAALLHRERNGAGSHIDVTLIESMMSLLAIQIQETQSEQALATRVFAPVRTADSHIMIPLVSLKSYRSVFEVIGRSDWTSDPEYSALAGVMRHRGEIDDAVAAWAAGRTTRECEAALNAAGVACSVYATPKDLFDDAHLRHRGVFAEMADAAGPFSVMNAPFRLSGVGEGAPATVARPGEHTAEVVRGLLGLSEEAYGRLKTERAFG